MRDFVTTLCIRSSSMGRQRHRYNNGVCQCPETTSTRPNREVEDRFSVSNTLEIHIQKESRIESRERNAVSLKNRAGNNNHRSTTH